MARKQRPPEDTGTWMNTYSDLVTLLLTFFVLLYSMMVIDAQKWEIFAKALSSRGTDPSQIIIDPNSEGQGADLPDNGDTEIVVNSEGLPGNFDELYAYLKAYTEKHNMQDTVMIERGNGAVFIRFNNNIFFYPDKAELKPESYSVLNFLGDCLFNVQEQIYLININGHTASVDYQFYPVSSWTLSGERATNLAIYLEDQKSIHPKKLRPIGYGDNYPVASNDTEEGRMQNRRVDMVIISSETDISKEGGLYEQFAGLFDPDSFPATGGVSDLLVPDAN